MGRMYDSGERMLMRVDIVFGMLAMLAGVIWFGWGMFMAGVAAIVIIVSMILVEYFSMLVYCSRSRHRHME